MSGPNAESGHAPEPADPTDYAERIARRLHEFHSRMSAAGSLVEWARRADWDHLSSTDQAAWLATVRGAIEAGVIVAGPAVTGRIEEAK